MRLFSYHIPALKNNTYKIRAEQKIVRGDVILHPQPFSTEKVFQVGDGGYAMPSAWVLNVYPPDGSEGDYTDVLPQIVLSDPELPWRLSMEEEEKHEGITAAGIPAVALLVLEESQLCGGDEAGISSCLASDFARRRDSHVLRTFVNEKLCGEKDTCSYITLTAETFSQCMPRLSELAYLVHCRQMETDNKADLGYHKEGKTAVVFSSRFPVRPEAGESIRMIVHLVALQGLGEYLDGNSLDSCEHVELISLCHFSFHVKRKEEENFLTVGTQTLDRMDLLRLPGIEDAQMEERFALGYVPCQYHTRSGESGPAWYRSAFLPYPSQKDKKKHLYQSPDDALIYDSQYGVFDCSLASAFEAGRLAALSDETFGKQMLEFRKKAQGIVEIMAAQTVCGDMKVCMNVKTLGRLKYAQSANQTVTNKTAANNFTENFIDIELDKTVQDGKKILQDAMSQLKKGRSGQKFGDIAIPVAEWLSNLTLLKYVSPLHLIPDERLLPWNSIRFFYVDENWTDALFDGALSIGMDCTRVQALNEMVSGVLHDLAGHKCAKTGVLIRGNLVVGWPNLEIKAYDRQDHDVMAVRLEKLTDEILLCLWDQIPEKIELAEPGEAACLGLDEEHSFCVRKAVAPYSVIQRIDLSNHGRSLNLMPEEPAGLIQTVSRLMNADGHRINSAEFAFCLLRRTEIFRLTKEGN